MLSVQPQNEFSLKLGQDSRLQKGSIWSKDSEAARFEKIREQKHARELLENYWPWEKRIEIRPRGLRNLRLEGLFPQNDFEKPKRTVLGMGRPGGGAPNTNDQGMRLCRTKEDPLLRFQWGKDLRKCVDNKLRYRKSKEEQQQYKQELGKLVASKLKENGKEPSKQCGLREFNGKELKASKRANLQTKRKNVIQSSAKPINNTQLSTLPDDCKGPEIELVPLMSKKRRECNSNALGSTDITKYGYATSAPKWMLDGQIYLQELSKQMNAKLAQLQESRRNDVEKTRKHFDTLNTFWGRPGHGAPGSAIKKLSIDKLLYGRNYLTPVAVA